MTVGYTIVLFTLLGFSGVSCTTSQNLNSFLKHPHYADGHQHSHQNHVQHSNSFPPKSSHEPRSVFSSAPRHQEEGPSLGPWSRGASKDFYKLHGYQHLKSTSSLKSSALSIEPSALPQEFLEVREANEHFVRMRSGGRCRLPTPQVLCVRDLYPDRREFLPRCTLLHRCTETSGCCDNDTMLCAPKSMQEVTLHFYVLGGDHRSSDVEKLLFVNHTECECQLRTPIVASKDSSQSELPVLNYPQKDQKHHRHKCRPCPGPFCERDHEDGRCSCDCFDRHKPCIRIKRGREALEDADRRCVLAGHCNVPDCDYGSYDPDNGRCPKRPDYEGLKGAEFGRRPHPNSRNPNHRWTYFERD